MKFSTYLWGGVSTLLVPVMLVFSQPADAQTVKLKKADLEKLFPRTINSERLRDGTKCVLKYRADGSAAGSCKGSWGKSSANGTWRIRGSKFCDKWQGAWAGEGGCSSVEKEGNHYYFVWRFRRVTRFQ